MYNSYCVFMWWAGFRKICVYYFPPLPQFDWYHLFLSPYPSVSLVEVGMKKICDCDEKKNVWNFFNSVIGMIYEEKLDSRFVSVLICYSEWDSDGDEEKKKFNSIRRVHWVKNRKKISLHSATRAFRVNWIDCFILVKKNKRKKNYSFLQLVVLKRIIASNDKL